MINFTLSSEHFEWLLGSLCQTHHVPFDRGLALQQCPPPHCTASLLEGLSRLPFTAGFRQVSGSDWSQLPMPCVAFSRCAAEQVAEAASGQEARQAEFQQSACGLAQAEEYLVSAEDQKLEDAGPPRRPALLVKSDGERILFFRAGSETPETCTTVEFLEQFEPDILFLVKTIATGEDPDDPASRPTARPFGLSWFVPELLRHKKAWRDILLGSLALQLVGLSTPLCTQVIIDKVVAHQTHSTLAVVAAALLIFAVFTALMTWLRQYMVIHTGNRIDAVLGSKVFRHLLHLPMPYFENRSTGVLVARLRGVEQIRDFLSGAAFTSLLDFPFLIIALAVMFVYSWQLTLIAVTLMCIICIMSILVTPIFRGKLDRQFLSGARAQAFLTEYIAGMNTVKSLQMEPQLERRYGDIFATYLQTSFSTRQVANTYNSVAKTIEQIMTLSILIVGALLVMKNDGFTIGMLVAFQMFAARMSQPMLRIVGLWQEFQQTQVSIARLADIMDMPQEPHTLTPLREGSVAGRIEFKDVSFRYSEGHPFIFRGLNLTLEPGKLTVIMGRSGCGKSTLTKLMQAFYLPAEGQILLDGKDVRRMAANELRRNYGVVPQETLLFSGTIYDNLIAAHPHANFERVVQACKFAEIHEDVEALPNGYQTKLGEHGVGLSGGQRQRLAIARALLKRPSILIFDEATSNLDQETAEHFARTVNQLRGKTTILFIAHRLPNALIADSIISIGPVFEENTGVFIPGTPFAGAQGKAG